MKRYQQILYNQTIEYPQDIAAIRANVTELASLSDAELQHLYREYSADWCAGWLVIDDRLADFKKWALEDL